MWFNYALEAAILANLLAQIVKVPIRVLTKKEWSPRLLISTGGMPSSHSAFVSALATAVGVTDGIHSTTFAISFCFAAVVIFDAMGIRRHAGQHAAMLNQLLDDLMKMVIFQFFKIQVTKKDSKSYWDMSLLKHLREHYLGFLLLLYTL